MAMVFRKQIPEPRIEDRAASENPFVEKNQALSTEDRKTPPMASEITASMRESPDVGPNARRRILSSRCK